MFPLVAGLQGTWLLGSMWSDRLKMAYGVKAGSDVLFYFLMCFSLAYLSLFCYKMKCKARLANMSNVMLSVLCICLLCLGFSKVNLTRISSL